MSRIGDRTSIDINLLRGHLSRDDVEVGLREDAIGSLQTFGGRRRAWGDVRSSQGTTICSMCFLAVRSNIGFV